MDVQNFEWKERKIKGIISRSRLVLFSAIQRVISKICTKFQDPRCSSSREMFQEIKWLKKMKYGQVNGRIGRSRPVLFPKIWVICKGINEDNQEKPQSQSTAFTRHQRKERWGTNNDKTNVTYETYDTQTKTTTTEETPWNGPWNNWCVCVLFAQNLTLNFDAAPNIFGPHRDRTPK